MLMYSFIFINESGIAGLMSVLRRKEKICFCSVDNDEMCMYSLSWEKRII